MSRRNIGVKNNALRSLALRACVAAGIFGVAGTALAAPWGKGTVVFGMGAGTYQVYDETGRLLDTLKGSDWSAGGNCAFNPTGTDLYTAHRYTGDVAVYGTRDPHSILQTIPGVFGVANKSIAFAANGDYFTGQLFEAAIRRYDARGNLLATYNVAKTDGNNGTHNFDLASNQTTIFYAADGMTIKRYDIVAGQLTDFAVVPRPIRSLRLLPPGDGSGGMLVAYGGKINRLDASGAVVQKYAVPGVWSLPLIALDPDGTSFWTSDADISFPTAYRFDLASGQMVGNPILLGDPSRSQMGEVSGLCVQNEPRAALQPLRCTAQQ